MTVGDFNRAQQIIRVPEYEEPREEGKAAMKEVLEQLVDYEGAAIAKDFINLTRQQGEDLDLLWTCSQIYTAGKLAGIRQERKRRKKVTQ